MAKWCHVCEKTLAGSLTRHLNQNTCRTPLERARVAAAERERRNALRRQRYRYNRYLRNRQVQDDSKSESESDSDVEIVPPPPAAELEVCAICQYIPTDPVSGVNCAHTFCLECCGNLANATNSNCPLCRQPFFQDSAHFSPESDHLSDPDYEN
jgi:hypothetical protein